MRIILISFKKYFFQKGFQCVYQEYESELKKKKNQKELKIIFKNKKGDRVHHVGTYCCCCADIFSRIT